MKFIRKARTFKVFFTNSNKFKLKPSKLSNFILSLFILLCTQKSVVSALSELNVTNDSLLSSLGVSAGTLKICSTNSSFLNLTNEVIEIPTFFVESKQYELRKYKIDKSRPMVSCPNGEQLVSHQETSITKSKFDNLYETSDHDISTLYGILNTANLLFENGVLSVGNAEIKNAAYYSSDEFCIAAVRGAGKETTVEFRTCPFAKTRPVLKKCCMLGMMLTDEGCAYNTDAAKWDPGYMDAETRTFLPVDKVNPVYQYQRPIADFYDLQSDGCDLVFHPVTDNTIAFITSSRNWNFLNYDDFVLCLDLSHSNGQQGLKLLVREKENSNNDIDLDNKSFTASYFYMISMYIGVFFHFLTTLVHLLTWKKQNIHGRTLCFCTTALLFMQFFSGTAHFLRLVDVRKGDTVCVLNGIGHQYFIIAAFSWLLIVNFDLWRTFAVTRVEGGSNFKRFLIFSSVGWLFPLLVSVTSVGLEFGFKCRASGVLIPDFGQHYCLVAPWAEGPYLVYILAVLMVLIFALAVLTLIGVYNVKKDAVNLRSTKRAEDQQNVFLYLKLSVVMGLTWVFELLGWLDLKENESKWAWAWTVADIYNALSAILIFIIFVCKPTTLKLLENSVPALKGIGKVFSKQESTFSSSNVTASTSCSVEGGKNQTVSGKSSDNSAVHYTKDKPNTESSNNIG